MANSSPICIISCLSSAYKLAMQRASRVQYRIMAVWKEYGYWVRTGLHVIHSDGCAIGIEVTAVVAVRDR